MFWMFDELLRTSPDTGGAGGGTGSGPAPAAGAQSGGTTPASTAETTDDAAGATGQVTTDAGENSGQVQFTAEQQVALNRVVQERLEREKEKWEKEVKAAEDRARKEADEARLAEQQNFQELANRRQKTIDEQATRIKELEGSEALARKYEKALKTQLESIMAHVPEHVRELLSTRDAADQLEWLASHQDVLSQDGGNGQRPAFFGPPPAPGGKGNGGMTHEQKRQAAYRPKSF